jgi:hypothetical protein
MKYSKEQIDSLIETNNLLIEALRKDAEWKNKQAIRVKSELERMKESEDMAELAKKIGYGTAVDDLFELSKELGIAVDYRLLEALRFKYKELKKELTQ